MTELFDILKNRRYKEYNVCQLPGCQNKLDEKNRKIFRKYCCLEHAKKAKYLYKLEWEKNNPERKKIWNHRYAVKRWKRVKNGELPNMNKINYENKKAKANKLQKV